MEEESKNVKPQKEKKEAPKKAPETKPKEEEKESRDDPEKKTLKRIYNRKKPLTQEACQLVIDEYCPTDPDEKRKLERQKECISLEFGTGLKYLQKLASWITKAIEYKNQNDKLEHRSQMRKEKREEKAKILPYRRRYIKHRETMLQKLPSDLLERMREEIDWLYTHLDVYGRPDEDATESYIDDIQQKYIRMYEEPIKKAEKVKNIYKKRAVYEEKLLQKRLDTKKNAPMERKEIQYRINILKGLPPGTMASDGDALRKRCTRFKESLEKMSPDEKERTLKVYNDRLKKEVEKLAEN